MSRINSLDHDFSLPYDLVEAYRETGCAEGAAFLALENEAYVISSSYGIPRIQTWTAVAPLSSVLVGSVESSLLIPASPPHAWLALFGSHDDARPVREAVAAKGASWAFFRSERLSAGLPALLDAGSFVDTLARESTTRGLPCVALASLDLSPLLAYVAENRPSAHTDRVQADFFRLLAAATRETGLVYRAPVGRALIVHFSRHPADPEMIGDQMHKVLRRAIGAPSMLDSVCESTQLVEMSDAGALGVLEAFAAGL